DSGGHKEYRYVIETRLSLGHLAWPAELTLTDRDSMKFRMLLGRTALDGQFLVDPAESYKIGKKPKKHKTRPYPTTE
ncbi:MAG: RimK/LysX family protein, partial [Gammaproteobacteria bacterium]